MSVAGFRPGLGRGGITHSFEVSDPGVPGPDEGYADGRAAREGTGAIANDGGETTVVEGVVELDVAMVMISYMGCVETKMHIPNSSVDTAGSESQARAVSKSKERQCAPPNQQARMAAPKYMQNRGLDENLLVTGWKGEPPVLFGGGRNGERE